MITMFKLLPQLISILFLKSVTKNRLNNSNYKILMDIIIKLYIGISIEFYRLKSLVNITNV